MDSTINSSIKVRRLKKEPSDSSLVLDSNAYLPDQHLASEYFVSRPISEKGSAKSPYSSRKLWKMVRLGKNRYLEVTRKNPLSTAIATCFLVVAGMFVFSQGSNYFTASITDQPSKLAFDGATYPFEYAPDWFAVGGANTRSFSSYSASELVKAPRYDIGIMQKDGWVKDIINTQITYPIVYMGKYKFDHVENTGSHPAIDIKLAPGTPVYSIANGIVVKSETLSSGYGQHIVVRHDGVPTYGTLYSSYSHLSKREAHVGDTVQRGEQIGLVGSTGNSTTAHIHFQVDKQDAPFYPYWPFSMSDASAAGYSFTSAVNAGFGKENGYKYTIHPFQFIHANEKNTNLVASLSTENTSVAVAVESTPVATVAPTPIPKRVEGQSLGGFRLEASPTKILAGETVKVTILAADTAGNFFETFDQDISLSYTKDGKQQTTTVAVTKGEGETSVTLADTGMQKITVASGSVVEIIKIDVVAPQKVVEKTVEAERTLTETASTEVTDIVSEPVPVFSQFQFSGPSEVQRDGTATILLRAIDTQGNVLVSDDFPRRGSYIITSKNGDTDIIQVRNGDLSSGVISLTFTPTDTGLGFVAIDGVTHEIKIVSSEPEISANTNIFTDVSSSHPNASAIAYLKKENIINGYSDGSFQPGKTVNRSEAIKMIFEAMNVSLFRNSDNPFSDVSADDWFASYVLSAYKKDIVGGYSDGSFKPAKTVSRAEYFKILINTSDLPLGGIPPINPFSDVERTTWFAPYAQFAKDQGLLDFSSNFLPEQGMTRGEVAESIYRLIR